MPSCVRRPRARSCRRPPPTWTARAEQERTAAETERSRAAARLAVAIGAPPDEPLGVETDEQTGLPEGTEQSLVARALAARPDLAAAREERARLETEAALARRS